MKCMSRSSVPRVSKRRTAQHCPGGAGGADQGGASRRPRLLGAPAGGRGFSFASLCHPVSPWGETGPLCRAVVLSLLGVRQGRDLVATASVAVVEPGKQPLDRRHGPHVEREGDGENREKSANADGRSHRFGRPRLEQGRGEKHGACRESRKSAHAVQDAIVNTFSPRECSAGPPPIALCWHRIIPLAHSRNDNATRQRQGMV